MKQGYVIAIALWSMSLANSCASSTNMQGGNSKRKLSGKAKRANVRAKKPTSATPKSFPRASTPSQAPLTTPVQRAFAAKTVGTWMFEYTPTKKSVSLYTHQIDNNDSIETLKKRLLPKIQQLGSPAKEAFELVFYTEDESGNQTYYSEWYHNNGKQIPTQFRDTKNGRGRPFIDDYNDCGNGYTVTIVKGDEKKTHNIGSNCTLRAFKLKLVEKGLSDPQCYNHMYLQEQGTKNNLHNDDVLKIGKTYLQENF